MSSWSARVLLTSPHDLQNVDAIQHGFSDEFEPMSARSLNIVTYALCGFSNIGSVGMTMSAMTAIAPGQTRVVNDVVMCVHKQPSGWLVCCSVGSDSERLLLVALQAEPDRRLLCKLP